MPTNVFSSALNWLQAGYPEGVPPKDVVPLIALLERSLSPEEVQEVCRHVIAENSGGDISYDDVRWSIERVKSAPPTKADINDIAARLAAVGWPLSVPEEHTPSPSPDQPGVLQRVLEWLRAGYPEGVPPTDYLPVLAVLDHRLSDEDVKHVAKELIASRQNVSSPEPINEDEVQALIAQVTRSKPAQTDIDRVTSRLARKGWPLQGRD